MRLSAILLILYLFPNLQASGATLHVPDDYATIQVGIDAASYGDTVLVADDTYTGDGNRDLIIRQSVVLMSENGADYTIIDADGSLGEGHRCIAETIYDATIVGFTFENGYIATGVNTNWAMGGAIRVEFDSLEIRNCLFRGNFAAGCGGAIGLLSIGKVNVVNCTFEDNVSPQGSAIGVRTDYHVRRLTVSGCMFRDNIADKSASTYGGGAIHVSGAGAYISYSWFENNRADGGFGGGAITASHTDTALIVSHCDFIRNSGTIGGAMSFFYNSAPRIEDCTFYSNVANRSEFTFLGVPYDGAGTIFYRADACGADTAGPGYIRNSIISFGTEGEALYAYASDTCAGVPQLECCDLYGNAGGNWSGAIEGQADSAGNISADPKFCDLAGKDFRLQGHSPCLPDNNSCGTLIGDYGEGCPILDAPQIGCFSDIPRMAGNPGEELCQYLPVSNVVDSEVTVSNEGYWSENTLCFTPLSEGLKSFEIIAANAGGADTCEVTILVFFPEVFDVYPGGQIQPMLDAAGSGDTVRVHDGIYTGDGNRDLDFLGKNIVLTSVNGPEECIIDCGSDTLEYSEFYRGIWFRKNETSRAVVNGLTFRRGHSYAIRSDSATPTIQNCVFDHNGLGVTLRLGSDCYIRNCIFTRNSPIDDRGAGSAIFWSAPVFDSCRFVENSGWGGAAAIEDSPSEPLFRHCTFIKNGGYYVDVYPLGGAIFLSYGAHPSFEDCTFFGNKGEGSTLFTWGNDPVFATFERCVIAFGDDAPDGYRPGGPIDCGGVAGSSINLSCCNIFGNTAGDYIDCIAGELGMNGNFSADPLFCDTAGSDVHVQSGSPCLAEYNTCGELIGALGSGCYNTPVMDSCVVQYQNVTVTYDTVTVAGHTAIEVDSTGPAMPGTIATVPTDPSRFYNISTSALYNGVISICISYSDDDVDGDESEMMMMHWMDTSWTDITVSHDMDENVICGETESFSPFILAQPADPLAVEDGKGGLPLDFHVSQNYPNPFNPTTTIEYTIPTRGWVSVKVYNVLGQIVHTLVDEEQAPGAYSLSWDGTAQAGQSVATGVYLYRLKAGDKEATRKMLLLK